MQKIGAPGGALDIARAVASGLALRCPVCGRGALFARALTYRVNEHCASCGVRFMPDRGEITGGMAINMVLTSVLGVAGVIYLAVFTSHSAAFAVAWLVALFTLFALWFHRHAHGLWVAMLYLTDNLSEPHPLATAGTAASTSAAASGSEPRRVSAGGESAPPARSRSGAPARPR